VPQVSQQEPALEETGDSEVVQRSLHDWHVLLSLSARVVVVINCAIVPPPSCTAQAAGRVISKEEGALSLMPSSTYALFFGLADMAKKHLASLHVSARFL